MGTKLSVRDLLIGAFAGLLAAPLALLLAYAVGLAAIAFKTRELFASLLAAATVLPLMLLFGLLLPTLAIAILTGLLLGLLSKSFNGWFKTMGSLLGLLLSEICISGVLPKIIVPQGDDLMTIVSNYFVSASYGVVIGIIVGWLTGKLTGPSHAVGEEAERRW